MYCGVFMIFGNDMNVVYVFVCFDVGDMYGVLGYLDFIF